MSLTPNQTRALRDHVAAGGTLASFVPPPSTRKPRNNEEWRIQSDFFSWWRSSAKDFGVWTGLFFHIPNGSMLGDTKQGRSIRAKMLKQAGVVSGVVDCFLAVPSKSKAMPDGSFFSGMWIEFKKPSLRNLKNGGCSDLQQEFMGYVIARGYLCHVCYSWEEARDATIDYLKR